MSSSASNKAYDMLIKLWDKLTRLNGVITPEAVNKLEDKLGGTSPWQRPITTLRDRSMAVWQVRSPKASTGLSLAMPPGPTWYPLTQERTLQMPSMQTIQQPCTNSLWHSTKPSKRVTGFTSTSKRQGRNSSFMQLAMMQLLPSRSNILALVTQRY
jgi:hypothetical protein